MPEPDSKRIAPFSLRLTAEERALLEKQAAGIPLGRFIKARLFGEERSASERKRELAQILALLGKSEYGASLRALAEAARIGALPLTPEVEAAVHQACRDISEIKFLLMKALRIKEQ